MTTKPQPEMTSEHFRALLQLIQTLRGPDGCPWDKKQTPRSIALYLIEEIYELVEAIESGNSDDIREELGDVLFQVFFIAELFHEKGRFDIGEVAHRTTEKMIGRHPHVFGADRLDSTEAVREQWHQIKQHEKKNTEAKSVLESIPVQLPALMRAYRISERVAREGFDWQDISGVMEKVEEEWAEFKNAQRAERWEQAAMELGDVFFTLVNVARFAHVHPETVLTGAIKKFEQRFKELEKRAAERGVAIESRFQTELDRIWEQIKTEEDINRAV
ncbi:MAG: nucleoside triphosphate pyrophosphohydrolase [Desulfobacterales bacterium]